MNDPTNPPPRRSRVYGFGTCPACRRVVTLRADGRLRAHGTAPSRSAPRCAGTGSVPSELPAVALDLAPVVGEPRRVRPPYDQHDTALDHLQGRDVQAWRAAVRLDRLAALLEPLSGLEVSEREHRLLEWLAGWDTPTVAIVAALLRRARAAVPLPASGAR